LALDQALPEESQSRFSREFLPQIVRKSEGDSRPIATKSARIYRLPKVISDQRRVQELPSPGKSHALPSSDEGMCLAWRPRCSAGFQTCRIADFQSAEPSPVPRLWRRRSVCELESIVFGMKNAEGFFPSLPARNEWGERWR